MTAAVTEAMLAPGALQVQRVHGNGCTLPHEALGGLGYGVPGLGALAGLPMPLLGGGTPAADVFLGGTVRARGRTGCVHWWHDGHWLFGHLDLPDAEHALEARAHAAYRDVFATLAETGWPHLLRLWNYLPRINADSDGLERYRRFNIGRQQAFIDSGHSAFEGAPAACALGTAEGGLAVRFIATRLAPRAIENPRQVSAYRYPAAYGPRAPTFSRAALADMGGGQVGLWISGTASIVGHASVHPGDVRAQTGETLANLRAVLAAAQPHTSAPLALSQLASVVYVRHAADVAAVREVLDAAWGSHSEAARQAVVVQADICRADLLVEVEAHLLQPGVLR